MSIENRPWLTTRRTLLSLMAAPLVLPASAMVLAQDGTPVALSGPTEDLVAAPEGKNDLIIGQAADISTLDPQMSTSGNDIYVTFNIFDNLVYRDRGLQLLPMLATEWSLVDDLTWEFKLRDDVTFHNGDPFTAADVEFTIERTYDPDAGTLVATVFTTVEDVEVVDDYTVRFHTKAPDPLLPGRLAFYGGQIIPMAYFEEVGAEEFGQAPIGTGPVMFTEHAPDERLVLTRNDNYWQEPIAVETVTFRPIPEASARIAALETGEVDIMTRIPTDQIQRVADLPDARVEQVLYNGLYVLVLNSGVEPLTNPLVKQALAHAIDRQLIIDELWNGQGVVPSQPAVEGDFAYDPSLEPYPYDPDRARELLDEAGYDGTPVVFETTDGYLANDRTMAEAIGAMWEEVGVTVDLQIIEASVRAEKNRTKEFLGIWWSDPTNTLADPDGMMWRLLAPGGLQDYWRDEEFDALGAEARSSLDPAVREANYHRMFQIMLENYPWIPILQPFESYGVINYVEWYPYANQYFNLRADNLWLITE
ncbi:MAG: ABC transporter substrate-binding protein [Chloroflexota bacterium]|nr:ABC transporter substrate-binding protein [Chloroflexota bacterium]